MQSGGVLILIFAVEVLSFELQHCVMFK